LACAQTAPYTFEWLNELSDSSSSTEEVISKLPSSLKTNYTLVLNSKSLQYGDAINPRVIFSTEDSTFIISFSGNPRKRGYESLEGMIYDSSKAKFNSFSITFDESNKSRMDINSGRCVACHTRDFKPIWEAYPFYSRFYGSLNPQEISRPLTDSETKIIKNEQTLLAAFIKSKSSHDRYRFISQNKTLNELFETNSKIGLNFTKLRIEMFKRKLGKKSNHQKMHLDTLKHLLSNLSKSEENPINLCSLDFINNFQDCESTIHKKTEELLEFYVNQREKKLRFHFKGVQESSIDSQNLDLFNPTLGFDDFEFGIFNTTTKENNLKGISLHLRKLSNLNFLLETFFDSSINDLNMTVLPRDLPNFFTYQGSGWRFFLSN
jgi:hypothetical protein